jgi:hypothetical protein
MAKKQNKRQHVAPGKTNPGVSGAEYEQAQALSDAEFRKELIGKQDANSSAYDTQILTLSSGALGLSLVFLKDIVPISRIVARGYLVSSWGCFIIAILSTLASFQLSQRAIKIALRDLELTPVFSEEEKFNPWAFLTEFCNYLSGLVFLTGVVLTAIFVWFNLPQPTSYDDSVQKAAAAKQTEPTSIQGGIPDSISSSSRPTNQPSPGPEEKRQLTIVKESLPLVTQTPSPPTPQVASGPLSASPTSIPDGKQKP